MPENSNVRSWTEIPACPTSAFKDLELSCLPVDARTTIFHSSGTTQQRPSRHFHNSESLRIYEESLLAGFSQTLDISNRYTIISLTPRRDFAPNSSLVHMFETFRERFGSDESTFLGLIANDGGWTLNGELAHNTLQVAAESGKPLLILGTAFLYVHLLDFFNELDACLKLPPGSHVLETGGYKGRSRSVPKNELHQLLCARLGISPPNIICEYGMSELSSQAYDQRMLRQPLIENPKGIPPQNQGLTSLRAYPGSETSMAHNPERVAPSATRILHFPPWARVQIISPETGHEVNEGETGLIRIYDLANVFSVMAIQTEDLGVRRGNGFELIGRTELAEPRGCSLMAV